AAEATLQPIRRFGFDAAILFADILVVPDALGQGVRFVEGEGPRLDAVLSEADLSRLKASATRPKFARVFETVAIVRRELPRETATSREFVSRDLPWRTFLQGNLDPRQLVTGVKAPDERLGAILAALTPRPSNFKLGHAIVHKTPPKHVARLVELVRHASNG